MFRAVSSSRSSDLIRSLHHRHDRRFLGIRLTFPAASGRWVERAGFVYLDSALRNLSGFLPGYVERRALRFCCGAGRAKPDQSCSKIARRRSCGRRHRVRAEVSLVGRLPVKARMWASSIVEGQVSGDRRTRF